LKLSWDLPRENVTPSDRAERETGYTASPTNFFPREPRFAGHPSLTAPRRPFFADPTSLVEVVNQAGRLTAEAMVSHRPH
jgi:hypothetical protein